MSDMPRNGTTRFPGSGTEIATSVRLDMYSAMWRARVFEKRAYDLFMQGLVKGTSHLGTGQEAVAAGFSIAMRKDDMVFCTYRGHNHTLLRGAPMDSLMGELLGRQNGCCESKGGRCTSPMSTNMPWVRTPSSEPTFPLPPVSGWRRCPSRSPHTTHSRRAADAIEDRAITYVGRIGETGRASVE